MTLPLPPDRWTIELANTQRLEAIAAFGFTERQARFLLNVLLHSGVFVERQYCSFAGIVHGQKSTDFIKTLIERRFATPIVTGKLHRGRMFHVHYKPLWAATGEPDSRFRKPTAQGRMIERVMLLDTVLDDGSCTWLGPPIDKRRHFMRHLESRLDPREYPNLLFGDGPGKTARYFPDKLPIGIQPYAGWAALFAALGRRKCCDQGRKPWRERPRCAHCQWPCASPEGSLTPWLSVSVSVPMNAPPPSTKAVTCAADVVLNRDHFVRMIWSRSCGKSWSPSRTRSTRDDAARQVCAALTIVARAGVHIRAMIWTTSNASTIPRSMLDLCSAPCKARRFAPPARARGLRALTVPARRSRFGHYVMVGSVMVRSWTDLAC